MNIYNMNISELRRAYARVARSANSKLQRLEKNGYANKSRAYKHIQTDAKMNIKGVSENVRFKTNTRKMNLNQIRSAYTEAEKFLTSNSITKTRIDKSYRQGYRTFKSNHEDAKALSYREYIELVEAFEESNLNQIYGSDKIIRMYAKISKKDRAEALRDLQDRLKEEEIDLRSIEKKYNIEIE